MILSMTAFARTQNQGNWGSIICEIRSINHRYLEMSMRVSEGLYELDALMRERIRHHIKRGKIECFLRYQPSDATDTEIVINHVLAKKLNKANEEIAKSLKNPAPINTMDILRWPGVLQTAEIDMETLRERVMGLLEETLQKLIEARAREGEELNQLFLKRLDSMKEEVAKVREKLPVIYSEQREKLITRFKDAKIELDPQRLEQEMVLFAQKIDVTEELDRLDTHISEVRRTLKHGGSVGRRLDFLMQELNREANTLGSKSVNAETSRVSVELKVLIEQMREQVQNIE